MKKPLIGFLFSISPLFAFADNNSALFFAAVIGGTVNTSYQGYMGRLPAELADWKDPATQSTSRLVKQCGVLSEFKLVRVSRLNGVFIGLRNESGKDLVMNLDQATITFGDGRERVALATQPRVSEVRKNWYTWGFLFLPTKSDFKGQQTAKFKLPITIDGTQNCDLTADFNRDPNIPEDTASTVEAPNLLVSIGAGSTLTQTGKFDDYTSGTGSSFEAYFAGFAKPEHGAYFNFSLSTYGRPDSTSDFENGDYNKGDFTAFSLGWVSRRFYSDKVTGYFNIGPEMSLFRLSRQIGNGPEDRSEPKSAFGVFLSYALDYRYARNYIGYWKGDFMIGVTPYVHLSTRGSITGINIDFFRGGE